MKVLVDTHCWLWWLFEPERLSARAQATFAEQRKPLYLSAASAWEIAIKADLGKLRLPQPAADFVPRTVREQGLLSLPITLAHALAVSELPPLHDDPFDRLLVAQARAEHAALLTADPLVAQYDVELIWAGPRRQPPARHRKAAPRGR